MFKQTITRTRPNTEVLWHFEIGNDGQEAASQAIFDIATAAGVSKETDPDFSTTTTISEDQLTLTVVRTSSTREWLDQLESAFNNTDHIINSRTKYYSDNGVTQTITTVQVED